MELSDGELIQLTNTKKTNINEEDYFKVIRKKTALLFATCTEVGAISVNADLTQQKQLKNFGELLGICFQIKDDIFDYYHDIEIGKPTGNDLQDGKVTLPLIHALQNSIGTEKDEVMSLIDRKDFSEENIRLIMDFARNRGGVDYAIKRMEEFKNMAIAELVNFPESEVKNALIMSVEFAAGRSA